MLLLIALTRSCLARLAGGNGGGTTCGEVSQKEVTEVFVREIDHINYLTIIDENDNVQVLEVTDSHPFWVVTDNPDLERAARGTVDENGVILYHENIDPGLNGFWVEAKDLREGDVFLGANGELCTFVSIERIEFPDGITVYNFTVEGNHNYFVIAETDEFGQTCVLVHNQSVFDTRAQELATKIKEFISKTSAHVIKKDIDWLDGAKFEVSKRLGSGLKDLPNPTKVDPATLNAAELLIAVTASRLAYTGEAEDDFVVIKKWGFSDDPEDGYVKAGLKAVLYEHDGKFILAFAGTDGLEGKDWRTNLGQPLEPIREGDKLNQYNLVKSIVETAKAECKARGHESIDMITGHSLGGGLATLAKLLYEDGPELYVFNPAYLNKALVEKFGNTGDFSEKAHVWHVIGDPLTVAQASLVVPKVGLLYDFPEHYYIGIKKLFIIPIFLFRRLLYRDIP